MHRTAFLALLSHWRRQPLQLVALLFGLAAATALWTGVQAINQEARASYDEAASALGQGTEQRLVGEGRVTGAHLADGEELDVDFVIVGVGIDPATQLASMAKLDIDNGIKTDEHCRTSDPNIWAAGD